LPVNNKTADPLYHVHKLLKARDRFASDNILKGPTHDIEFAKIIEKVDCTTVSVERVREKQ
jgi:hypothetical protein